MDKKELIIVGIIILVIAVAAFIIFSPSNSQDISSISILNKNTLAENGTLYVKLTNGGDVSLSDKTLHVTVLDKNDSVVFNSTTKTQFTGVGVVKLKNLTDGEYTVNVTFDGDANYTGSSISKKITIGEDIEEEDLSNVTEEIDTTDLSTTDDASQSQSTSNYQSSSQSSSSSYSSSSHSTSSRSSGSSSSSSQSSSDTVYDENGKAIEPAIDENGKITYDY